MSLLYFLKIGYFQMWHLFKSDNEGGCENLTHEGIMMGLEHLEGNN